MFFPLMIPNSVMLLLFIYLQFLISNYLSR